MRAAQPRSELVSSPNYFLRRFVLPWELHPAGLCSLDLDLTRNAATGTTKTALTVRHFSTAPDFARRTAPPLP